MDFNNKSKIEKENIYLHEQLSKLREKFAMLAKNNKDLRERVARLEGELGRALNNV